MENRFKHLTKHKTPVQSLARIVRRAFLLPFDARMMLISGVSIKHQKGGIGRLAVQDFAALPNPTAVTGQLFRRDFFGTFSISRKGERVQGARLLPRVRGAQARHAQMSQLFDDAGPAWTPCILRRGNRRRLLILWRKSVIVGVLCSHVARTLPSAPTLRSTVRISSRDRAQQVCSERAAPTAGLRRLL